MFARGLKKMNSFAKIDQYPESDKACKKI